MSEQPERRDQGAPQASQPEGTTAPDAGSTERPRYTPPPYVPPVTLDKDRGNPTEPIPSNPTQPLPPGAPPRPGTFQQPSGGQSAAGQQPTGPAYPMQGYPGQQPYPGLPGRPPYYGQQPYSGAPGQQPYPGLPGRPPYYEAPAPRGLSIAAMVCGISVFVGFGFLVLPQIAAVVLGHLGLAREPAGRGMALAGLVLGYIGIALTVAFLALFVLVLSMAPSRSGY